MPFPKIGRVPPVFDNIRERFMPDLGCPKCLKPLQERQLKTEYLEVGKCPSCDTVVQTTRDFKFTDTDAVELGNVLDIERLLDSYGVGFTRGKQKGSTESWEIAGKPFRTIVEYSPSNPGSFSVQTLSQAEAATIATDTSKLETGCFASGLQPILIQHYDGIADVATYTWGAKQLLSTDSLKPALLDGVIERLEATMKKVMLEYEV